MSNHPAMSHQDSRLRQLITRSYVWNGAEKSPKRYITGLSNGGHRSCKI
jgi:poly(3-hydroxybutyrate) depolymerase